MRHILWISIAVSALLATNAGAELTPEKKSAAEALIKQFNDDEYAVREKAVKDVIAMGAEVVPLLKEAQAKADIEEVRMRCDMAMKGIASAAILANSEAVAKRFAWSSPVASRTNLVTGMHDDLHILGVAEPPVRAGNMVLGLGLDGEIHAVAAASGKEAWVTRTVLPAVGGLPGRGQIHAAPVACGSVVVYELGGKLHAVDAETGKALWEANCDCPPAASGEFVFAVSSLGGLAALDARTGARAWSVDDVRTLLARPFAGGGRVLVGEEDPMIPRAFAPAGPPRMGKPAPPAPVYGATRLRAFDVKSGKEIWRATPDPCIDLFIAGGFVLVESQGKLSALGAQDGKEAWSAEIPPGERVTLDPRNGVSIVCHAPDLGVSDGLIAAVREEEAIVLDLKTGKETRRFKLDASTVPAPEAGIPPYPRMMYSGISVFPGAPGIDGPLAVAPFISSRTVPVIDGTAMVLAASNGLHAYDLATGERVWFLRTKTFPGGRVLLSDGVLYFGTTLPSKVKPPLPAKPAGQIDDVGLNALRLR